MQIFIGSLIGLVFTACSLYGWYWLNDQLVVIQGIDTKGGINDECNC